MFPMLKTSSRHGNRSSQDPDTEPGQHRRSHPVCLQEAERVVRVSAPVTADLPAELYLYQSWQTRGHIYTSQENGGLCMRQSCTFSWPIRGIIFLYVNGCRSFTVHQGSQGFHQSSAQTETIVARTWTFSTYTMLWPQAPECLGGFRGAGAGRQLAGQLCG